MKDIIKWLRELEHNASEMYQLAATIYSDENDLREFLEQNAEDEAWHYHVMGSAVLFLDSKPDFVPAILVDKQISDKISKLVSDIKQGVYQRKLSKEKLIEKIVELELTEWNDIFLYAINFMKEKASEFKYPAARIQTHVKKMEYFLSNVEGKPEVLQKIKKLPPIWVENILIVDDEEMVTDLIKCLLNRSGNIDIAHNGQEALHLMESKYYKLIISDIDMPIMDGLTFFNEAEEKYPALKNRFLFITGDLSSEREAFFNRKQVKYLLKPMSINVLREEAAKIIIST